MTRVRKFAQFESKRLDIRRLWVGAFIGVLLFSLLLLFTWLTTSSILSFMLLLPGHWVLAMLDISNNSPNTLFVDTIAYSVSSIPPAILGALFMSTKRNLRNIGFGLLALYLVLQLCYGVSLLIIFSD